MFGVEDGHVLPFSYKEHTMFHKCPITLYLKTIQYQYSVVVEHCVLRWHSHNGGALDQEYPT